MLFYFSVKINNFNIVFHQKLFVPCLWTKEKLTYHVSHMLVKSLLRAASPDLEGQELFQALCTHVAHV